MTKEEISIYWPKASEHQKMAISVYHSAGYTVEEGLDENGCVEMHRPNYMHTTDHYLIWPTGRVTDRSLPNAE